MDDRTLRSIPTLNLAFIGDGVYDLLVREYLVTGSAARVGELNKLKVDMVNCKSQAAYMKLMMEHLNEEEAEVYKRGRNTKVHSASKHSTLSDYHEATGLEALFGWLYLKGKHERINELFTLIINHI
ncbi:Mini-ribonuclease 3 [Ruminococcus sp.]|uniref:Mini-ribonuclease 3 n=1 Tax=Ruminococcus sp. TaxID=41978 RepID=UPI003890F6D9